MFCYAGGAEPCAGQNLISLGFESGPSAVPTVQLIGMEEIEGEEPLERLKQRSPEDRWNQLKREALSSKSAPLDQLPRGSAAEQLPELRGIEEFQPFTTQPNPERNDEALPELPVLPDPDANIERNAPVSSQNRSASQSPALLRFAPFEQIDPFSIAEPIPQPPELRADPSSRNQASYETGNNHSPLRPLGQINPYFDYESVRPELLTDEVTDRIPVDVAVTASPLHDLTPRLSPDTVFSWEASNIWHNPLYFEDPSLERYGHVAPPIVQPLISASRLGVQLFGLPYQMTIDPVLKRRYTLGWYRPGDEVPHLFYQAPWNLKAAAVQAGAVSAGVVILP
ncbi:MAG TPA: hypothetical protein VMM56_05895 [Planctomycetaceae bacterium]|nr:hypothetical protein [Planctomycetaceae bacterium]